MFRPSTARALSRARCSPSASSSSSSSSSSFAPHASLFPVRGDVDGDGDGDGNDRRALPRRRAGVHGGTGIVGGHSFSVGGASAIGLMVGAVRRPALASFGGPPLSRRNMSTLGDGGVGDGAGDGGGGDTVTELYPTFSDSMSKILPGAGSSPIPHEDTLTSAAEAVPSTAFEPTWWPADQALVLLDYIHSTTGTPYAVTVGMTTLFLRVALFPLFVKAQQNASRMAHMQPEFVVLKEQIDKLGTNPDPATQQKYMAQTRALFNKYQCNPLGSLVAPVFSAPVFISMFLAMRKAPEHFPDVLSDGGLFWFVDLTAPDPYAIMPLFSAAMFLGMTELGKEQMMATNPAQGRIMVNAFRALAVVMIPMTWNFNAAVFCYWSVNNSFSCGQSLIFKNKTARKMLGIWEAPKPIPGKESEVKNIFEEMKDAFSKKKDEDVDALKTERVKAHNEIVEQQKVVKRGLAERESSRRDRRGQPRSSRK